MRILCTFPGKLGDILWALPTVRAISETYGEPVHFRCCQSPKDFSTILPLLRRQPYLASAEVLASWQPREEGPYPFTPRAPETLDDRYDRVFHLGYEGWPAPDLPRDVYARAQRIVHEADYPPLRDYEEGSVGGIPLNPLDLDRPWITAPYDLPASDVCVGFTDEHFELKYGLWMLLFDRFKSAYVVSLSTSPRWKTEARHGGVEWEGAASWLATSKAFLGCCSALHVLACAVGTPVVLVEPNTARHNDVFYPYGKTSRRVTLVTGGDHQPTWDARHVGDAIEQVRCAEVRG